MTALFVRQAPPDLDEWRQDPAARTAMSTVNSSSSYHEAGRSDLLDVKASAVIAEVDWP